MSCGKEVWQSPADMVMSLMKALRLLRIWMVRVGLCKIHGWYREWYASIREPDNAMY